MKTFKELNKEQQEKAVEKELGQLLEAIMEGTIRFSDESNSDDLQKRIDAVGKEANDMQTPWFWGEYIMDTCKDDLTGMATCTAEDALYAEADEYVVSGII